MSSFKDKTPSRRQFLTGAAAIGAGAVTAGAARAADPLRVRAAVAAASNNFFIAFSSLFENREFRQDR